MKNQKRSPALVAGALLLLLLLAAFTTLVSCFYDENLIELPAGPGIREPPAAPVVPPFEEQTQDSSRGQGGEILWKFSADEVDEPISTPALADLNGDKDLEIIFVSSGDAVYALNPDGTEFWEAPYTDDVVDYMGQTSETSGLDFEPPTMFTSAIAADVDLDSNAEIFFGAKDGLVCLKANGDLHWKKGMTTGHYFSTATITDLQGRWTGDKKELEIVIASDDNSRNGWMEAMKSDGSHVFREEVTCGGEGGLIGCGISAADLDGSFDDRDDPPEMGEEVDTELLIGNHDRGLRIYKRAGNQANGQPNYDEKFNDMLAGHQTYATHAVGNFTGDEEYEILSASAEGYQITWEGWGGKVYCYDRNGMLKWDYSTGSSRAGIISSIAVGDVQCAKDDPREKQLDYEVFFGCDNGVFYCLEADEGELLWSYNTGGRIMSSPAICNIDLDEELEVIIGSDSGKVYCFDGDPTDGKDDGMSIPGDSDKWDLLWVADIGEPVGISSPVVADIDLDGVLEVVIADAKGSVYCIDAGGKSFKGQMDWPMFHNNLNNTGFYNPLNTFAVDISPYNDTSKSPPVVDKMVKYIDPGNSVMYNFTVANTGIAFGPNTADRFYISLEGVPSGWKAMVDTPPHMGNPNPDYVVLAPGESTLISLKLIAPWEGWQSAIAMVNVTVNSSSMNIIKDMITTITIMNMNVNFAAEFTKHSDTGPSDPYYGVKWDRISPGGTGVFGVFLENLGNCNDTYELVLTGIPQGWDAFFSDTGTRYFNHSIKSPIFSAGEQDPSTYVTYVIVKCPEDATKDEEAWIRLSGTSTVSVEYLVDPVERSDTLLLLAGTLGELSLTCDEPVKTCRINSTVDFELIVENLSNYELEVIFSYEGLQDGWKIDLAEERPLLIGQKLPFTATFTPPPGLLAGETMDGIVRARLSGASHIFREVVLTIIIAQDYALEVDVSPTERQADAGDMLSFRVDVKNLGNGNDVVTPEVFNLPYDWAASFNQFGFEVQPVMLFYNGSIRFTLDVMIPQEAAYGPKVITVKISGIGSSEVRYIKIDVNRTYDIQVFHEPAKKSDTIDAIIGPGYAEPVKIKVVNNANGDDVVNLNITGLFHGWTGWINSISNIPGTSRNNKVVNFSRQIDMPTYGGDVQFLSEDYTISEVRLFLAAGEAAYVTFFIKAPAGSLWKGTHLISLDGESATGGKDPTQDNSAYVNVTVLYPDLLIVDTIKITAEDGNVDSQDKTTVSATIWNQGDIEALNVVVSLQVDGKEIKRVVIKRIAVDTEQMVTFTWNAEPGSHKMVIEIDPEDRITEPNDQIRGINNNAKSKKVSVSGGLNPLNGSKGAASVFNILLIVLLVVLLVDGLGIFYYLRVARKRMKE